MTIHHYLLSQAKQLLVDRSYSIWQSLLPLPSWLTSALFMECFHQGRDCLAITPHQEFSIIMKIIMSDTCPSMTTGVELKKSPAIFHWPFFVMTIISGARLAWRIFASLWRKVKPSTSCSKYENNIKKVLLVQENTDNKITMVQSYLFSFCLHIDLCGYFIQSQGAHLHFFLNRAVFEWVL